jgi:hypothetical protein
MGNVLGRSIYSRNLNSNTSLGSLSIFSKMVHSWLIFTVIKVTSKDILSLSTIYRMTETWNLSRPGNLGACEGKRSYSNFLSTFTLAEAGDRLYEF